MTERLTWRRAVRSSRLPASVRLTLLTHSEQGPGHWHDETANEHAYARALLAERVASDQSTIRRHYRRAEQDGYLVMHEKGQSGQPDGQGRGRQTVFHYVTPSDPWACEACGTGAAKGGTKGGTEGRQKGGDHYPLSASDPGDRNASPSRSTPADEADGFAEWFAAYPPTRFQQNPRKVRAFYAEAVAEVGPAVLLDALRRWTPTYRDNGPDFVPAPGNWLRDRRWETAPSAEQATQRPSGYYQPGPPLPDFNAMTSEEEEAYWASVPDQSWPTKASPWD